ncbi:hypothetical protein [Synechococcus sp. SynAce01]|uniref:hypothetical protein n=1 Tax=Synechococcus sp. SynAce01 TaxID=1916956 RepID=UPI0008FF22B9|nr:hypothetical protein [Synechococcus sp. SynAce01]APD47030.1 hypothetical protein BM449_00210 [Synechococcus sp. SynAce01]
MLFVAPEWSEAQRSVQCQIVDVFALKVVTGFTCDPHGRLLLEADPSVAAGRSWSLVKACQLARNDARPKRWVVLQRNTKAWGLFGQAADCIAAGRNCWRPRDHQHRVPPSSR